MNEDTTWGRYCRMCEARGCPDGIPDDLREMPEFKPAGPDAVDSASMGYDMENCGDVLGSCGFRWGMSVSVGSGVSLGS